MSASKRAYSRRHEAWKKNEEEALAYIPESELDTLRKIARQRGRVELTTLKIPYSYGILMASHTYWTTVFMGRTPIHQFTGRHGETEQQIQALEALIDYQAHVGEMLVPKYMWLLDAGKYGLGVVGLGWVDEFSQVARIEDKPDLYQGILDTGKTKRVKINRRIPGYSGNRLHNVRPYDFYPDPRVAVRFFQKGEFCAARIETGWNSILKRMQQGYYVEDAVKQLRRRGATSGRESSREYGSSQIDLPSSDTFYMDIENRGRDGGDLKNAVAALIECTIELVPNEWGVGRGSYPEKWVFTVTNDYDIALGAQPLGANHDKFPYAVLEYEPEGYSIASRGIPEILKPVNDTMDWLINSHLYNVRKALNDQFVLDPTKVELSDLENPLPGGVIRLSPGAYGDDVSKAITQLPVNDVTRSHLTDMAAMVSIGQRTIGVSDQLMGQIATQGRRSATEVRTGAGFGINRLKTTAEFFSAMGWAPMSAMLVQNSQQYYDGEKKFKIVGQLAQEAGEGFINVTADDILGFYDFVPVDGTQPVDRLAQANLWQQLLGQLRNVPQVAEQYDVGRIFEWVAQLAGLKNVSRFKIQMEDPAMLQQQAQAGNVIPLPTNVGPGGGNPNPNPAPSNTAGGGGPGPVSQAIG